MELTKNKKKMNEKHKVKLKKQSKSLLLLLIYSRVITMMYQNFYTWHSDDM